MFFNDWLWSLETAARIIIMIAIGFPIISILNSVFSTVKKSFIQISAFGRYTETSLSKYLQNILMLFFGLTLQYKYSPGHIVPQIMIWFKFSIIDQNNFFIASNY